jgi:glucokinase
MRKKGRAAHPPASPALAVGVDMGGTNLRAAVIDSTGQILHHLRLTSPIVDPLMGRQVLLQAIQEVTAQAGCQLADLCGVGIGIPGWMDRVRGELVFAPKMAHWQGVVTLDALRQEIGVPVYVDSDPNVATLGEVWVGAGKGSRNLIMVTLGTGLGCGIVVEGQLYAGHHGMSGEFGHIVLAEGEGFVCDCGVADCLETQTAGPAIARSGQQAVAAGEQTLLRDLAGGQAQNVTTASVFAAAAQGDPVASRIVQRAGQRLGSGFATLVSLFEPEKIVVGGGMIDLGELFLAPIRRSMSERCYLIARGYVNVELVPALLGDRAGVIGAAALAFKSV